MNELKIFINKREWMLLSEKYSPQFLAENLSFIDALLLSRKLLEDEMWDPTLQTFAINLIKSIREIYPREWEEDWRHDAYLGYAYDLRGWDYEDKFEAYKKAANNSDLANSEVLMRLGMMWSCPGIYESKITKKQAIEFLEDSMNKTPYIEGVSCLIRLYEEVGDIGRKKHWEEILKESEKKKSNAPFAFLDFFNKYDK